MAKIIYIWLLILTLGLVSLPDKLYGCESKVTNTEKSCCEKSKNHATSTCVCKDGITKNHKECCGDSSCKCNTTSLQAAINSFADLYNISCMQKKEKQNKYSTNFFISTTFPSIWLIPKIG